MSSNALANSSRKYSRQKNNYNVELELVNETSEPVMFLTVLNNLSKDVYTLKLDSFDIDREKQLSRIFQAVGEIYEEVTRSFDQLEVSDNGDSACLTFEVAMGSFRKEKIELIAKKREGQQSNPFTNDHSPMMSLDKVSIQKVYHKDFNIFKEEMISICDKISKSELAKKITHSEKWQKYKIKNMFITFSNAMLKQYRKNTCFHDPKAEAKYVKYRQENKLLIQKNELLHNIYKKAGENTKKLAAPDLGIDFDLPVPKNFIVIMENGSQMPLEEYLPPLDQEETRRKMDFYEAKRQQLLESELEVNLIREKRLEDIERWLEDQKNKEKRLSIKGRNTDRHEASPHFQEF